MNQKEIVLTHLRELFEAKNVEDKYELGSVFLGSIMGSRINAVGSKTTFYLSVWGAWHEYMKAKGDEIEERKRILQDRTVAFAAHIIIVNED